MDFDAPDQSAAATAPPREAVGVEDPAIPAPGSGGGDDGGAGVSTTQGEGQSKGAHRRRWIIEWAIVLVVALGVAVGIRAFVVQTFFIPSASMEPTLMIGDRILVDKLSYHLHDVNRGDIVVFGRPPGEPSVDNITDLVKRVVGLPGEWIQSRGNDIWVDAKTVQGQPDPTAWHELNQSKWLPKGTVLGTPVRTFHVPAHDYFVMGDNRSNSEDSRFFGPIPRSLIVGKVVFRIWPLSKLHVF